MGCLLCAEMEQALKQKHQDYLRALVYLPINKKFAAYQNVEVERHRHELEKHRLICQLYRKNGSVKTVMYAPETEVPEVASYASPSL